MDNNTQNPETNFDETREMLEKYYKKVTRVVEFYVILSFVLIAFVPLLNFSWVPPFTKFIYFTGFPLLVILLLISLVKDSLLGFLAKMINRNK